METSLCDHVASDFRRVKDRGGFGTTEAEHGLQADWPNLRRLAANGVGIEHQLPPVRF
jgi:hypothetical protein